MPESRRNWQDTDTKTTSIAFQDLGLKTIALCVACTESVLPDKKQLRSLFGPHPAILTEKGWSVGDRLLTKVLEANFTGVSIFS